MATFEIGCPYWLYGPDGFHYASFNNPAEQNFAGYLTEVTGLDDVEVRESADVVPSGDGGINHDFFHGRRPWTISGIIMPQTPATSRHASMEAITGIMGLCMKSDGQLQWLASDNVLRYLYFRKQQPSRNTKGQGQVDRRFFIAGVAESHRIYSGTGTTLSASGASPTVINCWNHGTLDAAPIFLVNGPIINPTITNVTTGKTFVISGMTLGSLDTLKVDMTLRWPTVSSVINGVANPNNNGLVDLTRSNWDIAVAPARFTLPNTFTLTGSGTTVGTALSVTWVDSWL